MFSPFDDGLVPLLEDWVEQATLDDIRAISHILGNSSPDFVFEQRPFVERFFTRARQFGKKKLDNAISALWSSAALGVRSGIAGQPFPKDLKMKQAAQRLLKEILRFSPVYRVYEAILKTAEENIGQSARDTEALEDE